MCVCLPAMHGVSHHDGGQREAWFQRFIWTILSHLQLLPTSAVVPATDVCLASEFFFCHFILADLLRMYFRPLFKLARAVVCPFVNSDRACSSIPWILRPFTSISKQSAATGKQRSNLFFGLNRSAWIANARHKGIHWDHGHALHLSICGKWKQCHLVRVMCATKNASFFLLLNWRLTLKLSSKNK